MIAKVDLVYGRENGIFILYISLFLSNILITQTSTKKSFLFFSCKKNIDFLKLTYISKPVTLVCNFHVIILCILQATKICWMNA